MHFVTVGTTFFILFHCFYIHISFVADNFKWKKWSFFYKNHCKFRFDWQSEVWIFKRNKTNNYRTHTIALKKINLVKNTIIIIITIIRFYSVRSEKNSLQFFYFFYPCLHIKAQAHAARTSYDHVCIFVVNLILVGEKNAHTHKIAKKHTAHSVNDAGAFWWHFIEIQMHF